MRDNQRQPLIKIVRSSKKPIFEKEGKLEIRDIPGTGVRIVLHLNGKIYYGHFTTSVSS